MSNPHAKLKSKLKAFLKKNPNHQLLQFDINAVLNGQQSSHLTDEQFKKSCERIEEQL